MWGYTSFKMLNSENYFFNILLTTNLHVSGVLNEIGENILQVKDVAKNTNNTVTQIKEDLADIKRK